MGMGTDMTRSEAYEKYADDLVRFATGIVGPTDGPDLVSQAMLNVLWFGNWQSVEHPRPYLYRAVLNEARRNHRSTMRRRAVEARAAGPGTVRAPADVRPDVLEAVGRLSLRQRAVVFMAYWEDLRPIEIARRLGLSEGTVHRHLKRAEDRLKSMLYD